MRGKFQKNCFFFLAPLFSLKKCRTFVIVTIVNMKQYEQ